MPPHLHPFLVFITDIGDSACLIALIVSASIYLFSRNSRRAAAFLLASFLFAALLIGMLKLAFFGCRNHFHYTGIRSPSGHAATSAATLWACAILMRWQLPENRRFLPLVLLTILIALIGVSRVMLGAHTTPEVLLGLATGYAALLSARFFVLRGKSVIPFDAYAFALWCVVAVIIAHGVHLPAEHWLRALASHLGNHVPFCDITH